MSLIQALADKMTKRLAADFTMRDEKFCETVQMIRPVVQMSDILLNFNSNLLQHVHNVKHISSITEITIADRNQGQKIQREDISTAEFVEQNNNLFIALSTMISKYFEDKCYNWSSSEIRLFPSCLL